MATLAVSPLPITRQTIRQFARGKALLVAAGVVFFPVIFAVIAQLVPNELSIRELREVLAEVIYLGAFTATLLPIATLLLATGALGDEIDDRTLFYLTLKPLSRLRIVVEKILGVFVVCIPLAWAGLATTIIILAWGRFDDVRDLFGPILYATAAGVIGFGSLFLLLSLFIQRALLAGLFYIFVWESALARFLPGIRTISIGHYMNSIFVQLADDRRITIDQVAALRTSIITIIAVCVVSVMLATWRLRRMNLE